MILYERRVERNVRNESAARGDSFKIKECSMQRKAGLGYRPPAATGTLEKQFSEIVNAQPALIAHHSTEAALPERQCAVD